MKYLNFCFFAILSFVTAQTAVAQGMKWHPGHYLLLSGGDSQTQHFSQIDEIEKEPVIKGVQLRLWWAEAERAKGVYDFSRIDAYLKKLKSLPVPKRLVVRVMDRRFNTKSRTGIVPTYLTSESLYHGGLVQTSTGFAARLWEGPLMDRLIALYSAIGARYNSDVYFEGIFTEETTLSLGGALPSGYSAQNLQKQYIRLINAVRPAMPETSVFLATNYLTAGSLSTMAGLIQGLVQPPGAAGGHDVMPNKITMGQQVLSGETGADYRGILAIANSVESSELGGNLGSYTPKQINDFAYNKLHSNYMFWAHNTWIGNAGQRWSTGILPFLRTNPPIYASCPSSYGLCAK